MTKYKTWIELSQNSLKSNINLFRRLLDPKTRLWAVVKSNAYGHGLGDFSKIASKFGVDGFCVDSIIEGIKLRKIGIKKTILVLGPSIIGDSLGLAQKNNIIISISSLEALKIYLKSKLKPDFHLKIDTGMHRQGVQLENLEETINFIKNNNLPIKGVFTHFASAKNIDDQKFTELQFENFKRAIATLEKNGFKNLIKHCSATGGTLLGKKYHLDAVRIGIGLYGIWPSEELESQLKNKLELSPVLSWKSLISEVKLIKKDEFIGYDQTEKLLEDKRISIVPIGYWHGFNRSLSRVGEVLVRGKFARVLGMVSMDMITIDVSKIDNVKIGDEVVLIGEQNSERLSLHKISELAKVSKYEFVTRINPLIKKIVI